MAKYELWGHRKNSQKSLSRCQKMCSLGTETRVYWSARYFPWVRNMSHEYRQLVLGKKSGVKLIFHYPGVPGKPGRSNEELVLGPIAHSLPEIPRLVWLHSFLSNFGSEMKACRDSFQGICLLESFQHPYSHKSREYVKYALSLCRGLVVSQWLVRICPEGCRGYIGKNCLKCAKCSI